jgi:hypothetical protein
MYVLTLRPLVVQHHLLTFNLTNSIAKGFQYCGNTILLYRIGGIPPAIGQLLNVVRTLWVVVTVGLPGANSANFC